jgi:hypothetical protein
MGRVRAVVVVVVVWIGTAGMEETKSVLVMIRIIVGGTAPGIIGIAIVTITIIIESATVIVTVIANVGRSRTGAGMSGIIVGGVEIDMRGGIDVDGY